MQFQGGEAEVAIDILGLCWVGLITPDPRVWKWCSELWEFYITGFQTYAPGPKDSELTVCLESVPTPR